MVPEAHDGDRDLLEAPWSHEEPDGDRGLLEAPRSHGEPDDDRGPEAPKAPKARARARACARVCFSEKFDHHR